MPERTDALLPAHRVKKSRVPAADRLICPRCGRPDAQIIGRSESFPVVYLRCDECRQASVAPA